MTTYKIDGALFIENPIVKSYSRKMLGNRGDGTPVLSPTWRLDLEFSALLVASGSQSAFIFGNWHANTEHAAYLPHPLTGVMTTFSGVNISTDGWSLADIDRDRWGDGLKMSIDNIDTGLAW